MKFIIFVTAIMSMHSYAEETCNEHNYPISSEVEMQNDCSMFQSMGTQNALACCDYTHPGTANETFQYMDFNYMMQCSSPTVPVSICKDTNLIPVYIYIEKVHVFMAAMNKDEIWFYADNNSIVISEQQAELNIFNAFCNSEPTACIGITFNDAQPQMSRIRVSTARAALRKVVQSKGQRDLLSELDTIRKFQHQLEQQQQATHNFQGQPNEQFEVIDSVVSVSDAKMTTKNGDGSFWDMHTQRYQIIGEATTDISPMSGTVFSYYHPQQNILQQAEMEEYENQQTPIVSVYIHDGHDMDRWEQAEEIQGEQIPHKDEDPYEDPDDFGDDDYGDDQVEPPEDDGGDQIDPSKLVDKVKEVTKNGLPVGGVGTVKGGYGNPTEYPDVKTGKWLDPASYVPPENPPVGDIPPADPSITPSGGLYGILKVNLPEDPQDPQNPDDPTSLKFIFIIDEELEVKIGVLLDIPFNEELDDYVPIDDIFADIEDIDEDIDDSIDIQQQQMQQQQQQQQQE